MAGTCQVCGKTTTFGHNVSFSKRRTNRRFKANIQRKRLTVGSVELRLDICTRCTRTTYKTGKA
jgi:large subunit ribosomal protein L28